MAWNTPGGSNGQNSGGNGGNNNPRRNPEDNPLLSLIRQIFNNDAGIARWALLVIVVILLVSSFQLIGEQQRGVVLRFGQFSRVMQPGPNFKWPWPIESVTKVNATQINTFNNTFSVLTRDENIVNVTLSVQYRIHVPKEYLFASRSADEVLSQVAQAVLREQVGRSDLNTVLNARGPLASSAKTQLQQALDERNIGLSVTELNLQNARPPEEVQPAFDEVNSAQQVRESLINEAQAYAAKVVPEARGEAARLRAQADGYKTAKIARAEGDATRFSLLQAEYKQAPEVTRKRLWLETAQNVLTNNRKVIGGDGRQLIYVPMQPIAGVNSSPVPVSPLIPPETIMPSIQVSPALSGTNSIHSEGRPPRPTGRGE